MTVANVILEQDRVRVVGDTVGYRGKQPACFNRKIRIAERAGIAFIVRGYVVLGDLLADRSPTWADFETAMSDVADCLKMAPVALFSKGAEVTLLGLDDGRARASRLLAVVEGVAVSVRRFDLNCGVYLAPSLGAHAIPASMTDEQLLKVALLQQAISVRHGLNICVGGDVEMVEISAAGVAVRKLGEYPDKAMTAARIAKLDAQDLEEIAA